MSDKTQAYEHRLKTDSKFFQDVLDCKKSFEVRADDRTPPFAVGDVLHLQEYADVSYTGRECSRLVTYVLRDSQYCKDGFCVMGIAPLPAAPLKLSDLYNMDGEDILFVGIGERIGEREFCTVCVDEESIGVLRAGALGFFSDYGREWLAFRPDISAKM